MGKNTSRLVGDVQTEPEEKQRLPNVVHVDTFCYGRALHMSVHTAEKHVGSIAVVACELMTHEVANSCEMLGVV